jgi:hypothetical protein
MASPLARPGFGVDLGRLGVVDLCGRGTLPGVGGGGDVVAKADEFNVDASVAPGRVLPSHSQHQGSDRLWGGWAAWLSLGVGPAAGDEVGVPAQKGSG